jgi:hypothetical protein
VSPRPDEPPEVPRTGPGPLRVDRLVHYAGIGCLLVGGALFVVAYAIGRVRRGGPAREALADVDASAAMVAWSLGLGGLGGVLVVVAFFLTRPWRP